MKKLTLSARESTIETAKRLAAENGTTVSAMFERMILLLDSKQKGRKAEIGPATRNASGLIRLVGDTNGRDVLEEALLEKYNPAQ
ncbi:MAG: DUF6364 family protein [Planctomycetota bacterium]|nr:DUF6364 family protein [Planctomycetota bacterium]